MQASEFGDCCSGFLCCSSSRKQTGVVDAVDVGVSLKVMRGLARWARQTPSPSQSLDSGGVLVQVDAGAISSGAAGDFGPVNSA